MFDWLRRVLPHSKARFFKDEAALMRALSVGNAQANRYFALGLLHVLAQKDIISAAQAAVLLKQTAEMIRNNKGLGPLSDLISEGWDDAAFIFEPREPGPTPPGRPKPPPPLYP